MTSARLQPTLTDYSARYLVKNNIFPHSTFVMQDDRIYKGEQYTNYIAIGKIHNLLSICQPKGVVFDQRHRIDPRLRIHKVLVAYSAVIDGVNLTRIGEIDLSQHKFIFKKVTHAISGIKFSPKLDDKLPIHFPLSQEFTGEIHVDEISIDMAYNVETRGLTITATDTEQFKVLGVNLEIWLEDYNTL